MTAHIRNLAEMRQRRFRRDMADQALIDQAVKIANIEAEHSFEPYPEPIDLGWPLWAHIVFWLSIVGVWGLCAWLFGGQMLPPDFVRALQ